MRFVIFKSDVSDPNVVVTTEAEEQAVVEYYNDLEIDLMNVDDYVRMVFASSHIEFVKPSSNIKFICLNAANGKRLEPVESND